MCVLLAYLAGSPASVLENTLVEKEQVASAVLYEYDLQPTTAVHFTLSGVATEALEDVETRFFEVLGEAAEKPLDMEYMQTCIKREKRQKKFLAENPSHFFTEPIVTDFLFGKRDGSTLRMNLEDLRVYDVLETSPETRWNHWLKNWFLENFHVSVIGKPSASLSASLRLAEEARIETRKISLENKGLEELQKRLASAKLENGKEVPETLLRQLQIPGVNSIHFVKTATARSGTARALGCRDSPSQQLIDLEPDLPLFLHFEHIESNFAYITVVLGIHPIAVQQRPLLVIYMENFFSAPMLRGNDIVDFEQILKELDRDCVSYDMELGSRVGNPETIAIRFEVEVEKYATAIRWLKDLMSNSVFDTGRLKATTARLLADIPDEKRDGSNMANSVELMIGTAPSSAGRACNTLVKAIHLKRIKRSLEKDPHTVINQLEAMNSALCTPSNFRILVSANLAKLQRPVSSWNIFTDGIEAKPLRPLETRLSQLSEQGKYPGSVAYIVPMPPVDSSFVLAVSKGLSSYEDPAFPAFMVATSFLNIVEGPLWTALRGTGLAYGSSISSRTDAGQVLLSIDSAPDPLKAYFAAGDVVKDLVTGASAINTFTLEAAVSSIVLGFAYDEATQAAAAQSSFVRQVMRGLPKDWPDLILQKVREVTAVDLRDVLKDIVLPLFEAKSSNLFITCAPIMEKNAVKGLRGAGFEPQVQPLTFFQDDYGFGADESEVDEEGDEDDDEMADEESEEGDEEDEGDESDEGMGER